MSTKTADLSGFFRFFYSCFFQAKLQEKYFYAKPALSVRILKTLIPSKVNRLIHSEQELFSFFKAFVYLYQIKSRPEAIGAAICVSVKNNCTQFTELCSRIRWADLLT